MVYTKHEELLDPFEYQMIFRNEDKFWSAFVTEEDQYMEFHDERPEGMKTWQVIEVQK